MSSYAYEFTQSVGSTYKTIIPGSGSLSRSKFMIQNQDLSANKDNILCTYTDDAGDTVGLILPPLGIFSDNGQDVHQGTVRVMSLSGRNVPVYGAYN